MVSFESVSASSAMVAPLGCTCRLGVMGACPVWYADLRDCAVHGHLYDESATPQWWIDFELENAHAALAERQRQWRRRNRWRRLLGLVKWS